MLFYMTIGLYWYIPTSSVYGFSFLYILIHTSYYLSCTFGIIVHLVSLGHCLIQGHKDLHLNFLPKF